MTFFSFIKEANCFVQFMLRVTFLWEINERKHVIRDYHLKPTSNHIHTSYIKCRARTPNLVVSTVASLPLLPVGAVLCFTPGTPVSSNSPKMCVRLIGDSKLTTGLGMLVFMWPCACDTTYSGCALAFCLKIGEIYSSRPP